MDPSGLSSPLKTSQTFLSHRNFYQCRNYALRALQSDPTNPAPPRLLAISGVLAAATRPGAPDWYAIVGLSSMTNDPTTIRTRVDWMKDIVNPNKNPHPFAEEAYGWVLEAAAVLSDPESKARYDAAREEGGASFWTVCPYCYYMYEYRRVYEGFALRCQNGECRRAFTAAPVAASSVPPLEVAASGKYVCGGFAPFGGAESNGGWKWWAPFVSMTSDSGSGHAKRSGRTKARAKRCKVDVIDLSDDDVETTGAVRMRKKVAAVAARKLTGKGVRVEWNPSSQVEVQSEEEEDIYVSLKPLNP